MPASIVAKVNWFLFFCWLFNGYPFEKLLQIERLDLGGPQLNLTKDFLGRRFKFSYFFCLTLYVLFFLFNLTE